MKIQYNQSCRGGSSILAVFSVTLFAVLALSFTGMTNTNLQMAKNHSDLSEAQAAAESGLAYAHMLFNDFMNSGSASGSYNPELTEDEALITFDEFVTYAQNNDNLDTVLLTDGVSIPNATTFDESGELGVQLVLPTIKANPADLSGYILTFKQYDNDPLTLEITCLGQVGDITRRVRLNYTLVKDTSLLDYSVFSKSRIIVTGISTIDGDVYSIWDDADVAPPIDLASESTINGTVDTTVSADEWDGSEILGANEGIEYDTPVIDGFNADDFDTSTYYDQATTSLHTGGAGIPEYFPHAPGNYALPLIGEISADTKVQRKVYEGTPENPLVLTDVSVSSENPLFRNCVFNGVLFVGSGSNSSGTGTNNIRFENCTFNGTIATNVPQTFTEETWKKNVLYFTGTNTFNNADPDTPTILAPNYNVNLGNTQESVAGVTNTIKGLVVVGVVDLRGNVQVHGTVLSMGDLEGWDSLAAAEIATNLGFSGESPESGITGDSSGSIMLSPSSDRRFPMGVRTDTLVIRDSDSYVELLKTTSKIFSNRLRPKLISLRRGHFCHFG